MRHKSETVAARCTPMEQRALMQIAHAETGGSPSAAIRVIIREAADRRGLWQPLVQEAYEKITGRKDK